MTQRLGLAAALVHDPEVLLLDEPTDGVDPVGRREIRDLLREEAARGRSILLNSHLLSEIELTCDRVAVLRRGKVAAQGRIADLTAQGSRYRMAVSPVDEPLLEAFRASGAGVERVNGHLVLTTRDLAHLNALVDTARAQGEFCPSSPRCGRASRTSSWTWSAPARRRRGGEAPVKAWLASVEEFFPQASARWTLLAYFALSSLSS